MHPHKASYLLIIIYLSSPLSKSLPKESVRYLLIIDHLLVQLVHISQRHRYAASSLMDKAYRILYQEPKFLIKMPPRRNRDINDIYERELEQRIIARMDEGFDQFVDQFVDRMNDMMNPRRRGDCNSRRSEGEESENPFFKGDGSSLFVEHGEWKLMVCVEEELMLVYDTDIEDVIKDEEGFVGKRGFGEEENNMDDVVVVANDLCSSKIQTVSVDFSKTLDSNPHELILLQKGHLVEVSILICKKYQEEYLKVSPMDDKFGFKLIKVRGRVIIKKRILMQGIQIWMLRVQGTSKANSRMSFFQVGGNDAIMPSPYVVFRGFVVFVVS
ncbi:hypothetical protein Tco_0390098 [Tanacetum coccineum]